jgi:predicted nucleic acid-binding protein
VIADDPDDNRLLECAVTSGSLYIISGDQHLLDLKEYQGIQILSPAGFVVLLEM